MNFEEGGKKKSNRPWRRNQEGVCEEGRRISENREKREEEPK